MRNRSAKILATIGPASAAPDNLRLLFDVGVDAFRLNFSHGSHEDHARSIREIKKIRAQTGQAISIVADMQGPKLRVGELAGGSMELAYGETAELVLSSDDQAEAGQIPVPHKPLFEALRPGAVLKLDDGKLQLTVLENDGAVIKARIDVPGRLGSRKGINVVDTVLPLSAMTEKDRRDMDFALSQGVDFIALSFVQNAGDVRDARKIIGDAAGIIAKIEKPSAVEELDEILAVADAAMVARGDLGVELPLEKVPVVQREIIRKCRALGKPVIVATHMLESMTTAPTPTRAEASDVATAIYLGTDAVMLSAETAVGRHPATAVAIMDRIIQAAEQDTGALDYSAQRRLSHEATTEDAISRSVRDIAYILSCSAVFGYTATGSTVQRISRERPSCRIIGLTPHERTANRLALSWGVLSMVTQDPNSFDDMLIHIQKVAKDNLKLELGSKIIITAGIPFGRPGMTDTLKIATVDG